MSRYQKKHSPTQLTPIMVINHLLLSSITIHVILPVPSTHLTISLQVFFRLPLRLATSTSYSIHFITQSLSYFRNTCPYHRNLFHCSNEIMTSNPSLKHTHITQPFYNSLDFVWDNLGEPVPEETFAYSHLSWSSIIPHLLPPYITIHGILSIQFMYLKDFFHNLSPSFR